MPGAQSPLLRRQLEPLIDSLVVEYLDDRTNRWYPAEDAATIRPKAVRLTMHAADSGSFASLLRVPMVLKVASQGGMGSMGGSMGIR